MLVLSAIAALALPAVADARDFPRGFLWGTAISGFQTEPAAPPRAPTAALDRSRA